jgi:hypothetical protein
MKTCIRCYSEFSPRNGNCDLCMICKKPNKCVHGTSKGRCKIDGCFGKEICIHKEHKQKCSICKPGVKELDKLNSIIRKIIKNLSKNDNDYNNIEQFNRMLPKTKSFIMNLWRVDEFTTVVKICSQFITSYEENGKKFEIDYYHIDHIIPKSRFNLTNKEEFYMCCNYNNLQILNKHENLKKSNK